MIEKEGKEIKRKRKNHIVKDCRVILFSHLENIHDDSKYVKKKNFLLLYFR